MKRILSLLMLLVMLVSLLSFSPAAFATGDTPEATPAPTAAPEATPAPTAAPEATPAPTAAPEATPAPTAAPEATPAPTAAPEATPAPTAAPEATPAPTAAPDATPAPTAEPPKVLEKVTVTLDRTPVVLMPVSESHGAVSLKNASFAGMTWYDANGKALSGSDQFAYQKYRVEIRAMANEGYVFAPEIRGYLNNSAATTTVSADGKYATVTREYEALVYAPRVIKHPGAETIEEGSWVSYVSTAAYALGLDWEFTSPDGKTTFTAKDLAYRFPSSRAENDGVSRVVIYNVTRELDGWTVRAVFSGAQSTVTRSNPVTISVKLDPNKPAETPAPEETAAPEETPAPEETAAPEATPAPEETAAPEETTAPEETAAPEDTAAPDGHTHRFSVEWVADENEHWRECACGVRDEQGSHSFRWKTTAVNGGVAVQQGVCSVCGYQTSRETTVNDTHIINKIPMRLVIPAALGLMLVLVLADAIRRRR